MDINILTHFANFGTMARKKKGNFGNDNFVVISRKANKNG